MSPGIDNALFFEKPELWDGRFANDPQTMEKFRNLKALIPADVATVIDVGCGDGTFLNMLVKDYHCIGVDRSQAALNHVKALKIRGSIDAIPKKDYSADLVINSEVLEHLPDKVLRQAVVSLSRLTRKYLMIGVPYKENLVANSATCSKCGRLSNFNTHVQSFKDYKDLLHLFPSFKLKWVFLCGQQDRIKSKTFVILDKAIRGGFTDSDVFRCPHCGGEPRRTPLKRWWPLWRIMEGFSWRMKREILPWWQVILLERIS